MKVQIMIPAQRLGELERGLIAITAAIDAVDPEAVAHGLLGGAHGYGANFDCDVFQMRPFYWGDCDCDGDERSKAWWAANPHATDCYGEELRRRKSAYDENSGYNAVNVARSAPGMMIETTDRVAPVGFTLTTRLRSPEGERAHEAWRNAYNLRKKAHERIARTLCKEYGLPRKGGSDCTCGTRDRAMASDELRHRPTCALKLPNFLHKPSGFEVRWYKYIGRDTETKGDPGDISAMISDCLSAIGTSAR